MAIISNSRNALSLLLLLLLLPFALPAVGQTYSNYRISGSDVVQVVVYREADLTAEYRVSQDGRIDMPLIGMVKLGGLSTSSAAQRISAALKEGYLVNPQVTVKVTEYRKERFTVLGQVTRAGTFDLPPNSTVTLLEAIGMAGGYTRLANQRKVMVKRMSGGKWRVATYDAKSLARTADAESVVIRPGDVIRVPESAF